MSTGQNELEVFQAALLTQSDIAKCESRQAVIAAVSEELPLFGERLAQLESHDWLNVVRYAAKTCIVEAQQTAA